MSVLHERKLFLILHFSEMVYRKANVSLLSSINGTLLLAERRYCPAIEGRGELEPLVRKKQQPTYLNFICILPHSYTVQYVNHCYL